MRYTSSWFTDEYERRKSANPQYSLRAFARDLGISKSTVWEAVSGRRTPSRANITKVVTRLGLGPKESLRFFRGLGFKDGKTRAGVISAETQMSEDQFRLIADWYYLAILNLAGCGANSAEPAAIAERLSISSATAQQAIERLDRLGLIKVRAGKLVRIAEWIETTRDVPSAAIRMHHRQMLDKAAFALENVGVEQRHFDSLTLAIDREAYGVLKKHIDQLGESAARVAKGCEATDVYALTVQLFPLTKLDSNH